VAQGGRSDGEICRRAGRNNFDSRFFEAVGPFIETAEDRRGARLPREEKARVDAA
jgi:hypothetical protein